MSKCCEAVTDYVPVPTPAPGPSVARFCSFGRKPQEPISRTSASHCTYIVHCIWLAGVLSISAEGRAQSLMGEVRLLQDSVTNAGSGYIVHVTPISNRVLKEAYGGGNRGERAPDALDAGALGPGPTVPEPALNRRLMSRPGAPAS